MTRFVVMLLGLVLAALALVAACSPPPLAPVALRSVPKDDDAYFAGTAVADITPPLHLSLFGHGPEARVATGVRLRLRCEVFVLASGGEVVALLPCDLQSPSMALVHGIADALARAGVPITADRIFLMATHTHAGPAHYFEARRYSGPFSSSIPGYDPHVVAFLSERIAGAIATAFATLQPACLGWGQDRLSGFTFNRSYVPFLANHDDGGSDVAEYAPLREAKRAELPASASGPRATTGPSASLGPERAIDPSFFALRVERREGGTCDGGHLLGALAIFGMHPTGIPNTNELYHGDIFGFATRTAEACLSHAESGDAGVSDVPCDTIPGDGSVVVGLANGAEGDISPKLDVQSVPEARKLGRELGQKIDGLVRSIKNTQAHGELKRAYWELSFPNGWSDDDPAHRLCPTGEIGMAATGGARDGPTRLRVIPEANAGFRPPEPKGCHRYKLPVTEVGSNATYDLPTSGPIALVHVGEGWIATVPGEVTTMTGFRIKRALRAHLGLHAGANTAASPLAIVGLTDQYFQYFATPEEYDFQYYEGASTLYGIHSSPFLVRHFGCLADILAGRPSACDAERPRQPHVDVALPLHASPAPVVTRWPAETDVQFVVTDPVVVTRKPRDGAIGWEMEIEALPLTFTSDRAWFSVQVLAGNVGPDVVDDDRGSAIEVREVHESYGERWRIRWIPDFNEHDARCGKEFRLAVHGRVHVESRAFRIDGASAPDQCPR